jgi:hypothetical protein
MTGHATVSLSVLSGAKSTLRLRARRKQEHNAMLRIVLADMCPQAEFDAYPTDDC